MYATSNPCTRAAVPRDRLHHHGHTALRAAWAEVEQCRRRLWPDPTTAVIAVWDSRKSPGMLEWRVEARRHRRGRPVALVAGAHTECDLARLPGASLRHAVLLAWAPTASGPGVVEVIDLRSASGIAVPRDMQQEGMDGVGVGNASVFVVQAGQDEHLHQHPLRSALDLPKLSLARAEPPCITRFERSAVRHSGDIGRTRVDGPVKVLAGRRSVLLAMSDEAWEGGVMLGRYDRCDVQLGRSDRVSRVHALLLERRGKRFVVDCGSTNGTAVADVARDSVQELASHRRVVELPPIHRLELAGSVPIMVVSLPEARD